MADIADDAARINDLWQESALALHKAAATPSPVAIGSCLTCGEPTVKGRRWCDADCRDEWEAENG